MPVQPAMIGPEALPAKMTNAKTFMANPRSFA
jgi:hypothetical protein